MHLILFVLKCFITRFNFFHLSPLDQALELKRNHLYYLAGRLYLKEKAYKKAIYCFEKCHAYRSLMYCYEKLGNTSVALEVADKHHLYKEGAMLCKKHNNDKKAAYFYKYYNPYLAAKLYKKCSCYYEAGLCMLENHQYLSAIETFYKCTDPLDKLAGLRQVEEVAIVMYLKKFYYESMHLFTALGDYYSVLECAKRLDDPVLIDETSKLIASFEAEDNNYALAAHYIASSNHDTALLYTYLSYRDNDALKLSLFKGAYFNALKICFHNNDLPLAKQVAKLYA
ncbi:hypothetical protein PBV87_03900 [Niameybacter massiliensis]|uniref:Uncharacterized protein n=1 Tax=Holtiella tumoricola TaxID=3018743 RepID=A0AA42DKD3_9FIRM|nr:MULTISPECIES: hypothetical protein [Lachnospirales]MDA3730641.1 hypothetical protein [Holtiella tumoricola]